MTSQKDQRAYLAQRANELLAQAQRSGLIIRANTIGPIGPGMGLAQGLAHIPFQQDLFNGWLDK